MKKQVRSIIGFVEPLEKKAKADPEEYEKKYESGEESQEKIEEEDDSGGESMDSPSDSSSDSAGESIDIATSDSSDSPDTNIKKLVQDSSDSSDSSNSSDPDIKTPVQDSSDSSDSSEEDSSEEDSGDSGTQKLLIKNVTNHLIRNDKKQIQQLLDVLKTEYEREKVETLQALLQKYFGGKKDVGEVFEILSSFDSRSLNPLRLKILLNGVERTTTRVRNVLNRLINIEEDDLMKTLEHLKLYDQITEQEFERLLITPHDISGYAKALKVSGIWI